MTLALTDEQAAALLKELDGIIDGDRYPLSPRIRTLVAIRAKLRPEPVREPLPEENRLAAALLLPEKQFRADIRRLGKPETAHILKLAARYQTSKEATARRYTELSDDPCAIVFSRGGQVRSYCKGNGFPRLTAVPKQSLPMGSLSLKTASRQLPSGTLSDWAEVDASVWLENDNQLCSKTLCEQYLQQANGYRLTMLTFDPIDDDEVDEQDDLEDRWAICFRK
jgi:hypothetical protein